MPRLSATAGVAVAAVLAGAGRVRADELAPTDTTATSSTAAIAPSDMSDQGIAASLGVAGGGRTTAGGLRIVGHYLYQLSAQDWFDGTAAFTFGSGAAGCFRDRMNERLCDHGLVDGTAAEVAANVRRFFGGQGEFWPFARAGIGVALVRFGDDAVSGLAIPLHVGGGFRVSVSPGVAVITEAVLDVGLGVFSSGLGLEPQLGGSVTAGAEFRL